MAVFSNKLKPPAREAPGKRDLRHALGQRHNRGEAMGRRAAYEYGDAKRPAPLKRIGVVYADIPAKLVMEADFPVLPIFIAPNLNPVHTEIRMHDARFFRILRVDLGQKDKGAAVFRPASDLREFFDFGLTGRYRCGEGFSGPHPPGRRQYFRQYRRLS